MNLRWKSAIGNLAAALMIAAPALGGDEAAAPEAAAEPTATVVESSGCSSCSSCSSCAEEEAERWTITDLFTTGCGSNILADNGFLITGSLLQSYTFNFDGPNDRFNGPVTWTDRSNEYQLNQLYMTFARETDTEDRWLDIGGRVDVLYGTNARFIQAFGLDTDLVDDDFYGLVLPQMYGEVAMGDLTVKIGRFASTVGYFGIDPSANIFNTLPYTYQYGEPFTHTGIMTMWDVSDKLAVHNCVIRGWDNWNSQNALASPGLGYLGGFTYTMDSGASLAMVFVYSNEATQNVLAARDSGLDQFAPRYLQTFVYQQPIGEKLTYVFQSDFGVQTKALVSGKAAQWYGVNQYLLYAASDTITWAANFEWFQDDDGFRVGGFLPLSAGSDYRGLPINRVGYEGAFWQCTFGPKWSPNPNLFVRPNVRFDWFSGESNNGAQPFDDGTSDFQAIIGTDIGILF